VHGFVQNICDELTAGRSSQSGKGASHSALEVHVGRPLLEPELPASAPPNPGGAGTGWQQYVAPLTVQLGRSPSRTGVSLPGQVNDPPGQLPVAAPALTHVRHTVPSAFAFPMQQVGSLPHQLLASALISQPPAPYFAQSSSVVQARWHCLFGLDEICRQVNGATQSEFCVQVSK
jgi:hypothetical protein